MHISEGILNPPILVAGALASAAGIALGLRRLTHERIPEAAVLSSAFFIASFIHVPIGFASAHLVLNGLIGAMMGWVAFPVIFIGLLFQALLFQFGGFTTLGVNTLSMALPAVAAGALFAPMIRSSRAGLAMAGASAAGALAVALSGLLVAGALAFGGEKEAFTSAAQLILYAHLPIMAVEAIVTGFTVSFLRQVNPELLEIRYARSSAP